MNKQGIILVMLLFFMIAGCNQRKDEPMFNGIELGMNHYQVDSVLTSLGMKIADNRNERVSYNGEIEILGKQFNCVGIEFNNDSVSSIEFQDWYSGKNTFATTLKAIEHNLDRRINSYRIKQFGTPFEWAIIRGDDNILVSIDATSAGTSLTIAPQTELNIKKQTLKYTSREIDNCLEELANDMASYLKENDPSLKRLYEDDIVKNTKYLQNNMDKMNARQKELFLKLKSI